MRHNDDIPLVVDLTFYHVIRRVRVAFYIRSEFDLVFLTIKRRSREIISILHKVISKGL